MLGFYDSKLFPLILMLVGIALQIWPPIGRLSARETQTGQEETSVTETDEKPKSLLDLANKTGGGTQLWTDHHYRGGYRIQQNALTTHWRLLDANDVRRAWGTRAHCEAVLDDVLPKETVSGRAPRHVVVLLHGLMRTHHSMKPVASKLAEHGYHDVIRFSYASTRSSIGDHAAALRELIEGLPNDTQLSFVGHSMGCIVVRHLMGDLRRDGDPMGVIPRCRSMVMLGPPNQGAAIARRLAPSGLYGLVMGKGGMELGPQWDQFVERLATPPFPFMIIAGDRSSSKIQNPLVEGSSDFVVGVDEARLEGSESFQTLPVLHSFLMNDEAALNLTVDFIQSH